MWNYMQEYKADLSTKAAWVRCTTMTLEGNAVEWMVSLHNDDAPELRSFDWFMMALCKRFEDPLAQPSTRVADGSQLTIKSSVI